MSATKRSSSGQRRSRGQSLVEFALVFPIFLTILFGILDFGFLLYSRISVSSGTREAAHAAVTQIDNPLGIPGIVKSTVLANSTGLTWPTAATWPGGQVPFSQVCLPATGHPACDFVSGGAADPQSGDSIRVTTIYEYHSLFARAFGASLMFDAQVTMVIE